MEEENSYIHSFRCKNRGGEYFSYTNEYGLPIGRYLLKNINNYEQFRNEVVENNELDCYLIDTECLEAQFVNLNERDIFNKLLSNKFFNELLKSNIIYKKNKFGYQDGFYMYITSTNKENTYIFETIELKKLKKNIIQKIYNKNTHKIIFNKYKIKINK